MQNWTLAENNVVNKRQEGIMNNCLYCGSQNFLSEDGDPWINSSFQQENTGRRPLIL